MISTDVSGYRIQPVKHRPPVRNADSDLMNVPSILHWLHQNTSGIIGDDIQLLRPVVVVGLPAEPVNYLCTRHSANTPHRVVVPTNFEDYEIACAAVIAHGPLTRDQDVWLGTVCHRNTGDYRNWAFVHSTPVDSIGPRKRL